MDDNEYNLELPEHLRHLVAKDAPPKVQATLVEFEGGGEIIPLLAGAWRLSARPKRQQYRLQIFLTNREATSFMRLHSFSKQHISKEDYEECSRLKIKWMISGASTDRIERYFPIEGTGDQIKLLANRLELLYGVWLSKNPKKLDDTLFSHRAFASYREFFELSDEVVLERILAEMQDDTSEISLARRWANMDREEQFAFAFQCENGTWDEIKELFRCLVVVIASYVRTRDDLVWYMDSESFYCHQSIEALETRWAPFIKSWQLKIYEQFKPKYFLANQQQPKCLASLHRQNQIVVAQTSTYHERVEAQLRLSEWAHKNLSPEEAEALLQFE